MNVSSNLLTSVLAGVFLVTVALIGGLLKFKTDAQKNANDFTISSWDNYRKDSEYFSKRNAELTAKLEVTEAQRDKAEAACDVFRPLFADLLAGRLVTPARLATLKARLVEVGFTLSP